MNSSIFIAGHRHAADSVILRRRQVETQTGYSRSTIYLRIQQGLLTKAVSLGAKAVGWPAREVDAINAARIAGSSDADIQRLVLDLESMRGFVGEG